MNRRAELQRKLAIAPVPKPPADLAKRIKSEIPEKLRAENEADRERLSESIALNLRVAASILVLISTAFLALHLFSRAKEQPTTTMAMKRVAAPAVLTSSARDNVANAPTQTVAQPQAVAAAPEPVRAKRQKIALAEKKDEGVVAPPAAPPAAPAPEAAGAAAADFVAAAPMRKTASSNEDAVQKYAAPESVPARFALDVEAVENPLEPEKALVRASADWGKIAIVRLDVMPSDAHWTSTRYANGSHTMVLDVPADQSLAIALTYEPGDEPQQKTRRVITASDVKPWSEASRRTKAAVLAALWKRGADPEAVAAKAREAGLDDLAREIGR